MNMKKKTGKDCSCHSGRPYPTCCQPYHRGQSPPTPVALMRSRYAAYALGKVGYIMNTTHPDSPHYQHNRATWRKELRAFCQNTAFVGLQILETAVLDSSRATVTFCAILMQHGQDASFTECSQFVQQKGRWLYVKAL